MDLRLPSGCEWYNGGVPMFDGQGTLYAAGIVRNRNFPEKAPERFSFTVIRYEAGTPHQVPLQQYADGTGGLMLNPANGKAYWYAFSNGQPIFNEVPGFVPVPLGGGTVVVNASRTNEELSALISSAESRIQEVSRSLSGVDDKADAALKRAQGAVSAAAFANDKANQIEQRVAALPSIDVVWQKAIDAASVVLNERIAAWTNYPQDTWLFDTLWDRTVRLLRYKESKKLTAEQLPLNNK